MIFEHNKEQSLLRDMVRGCAKSEFLPLAKKRDENERFDWPLMFDRRADYGLTGIIFPEESGGAGGYHINYSTAVDELSRVRGSTAVTLSVHPSLGSNPIFFFGSEQHKEKFFVASGDRHVNEHLWFDGDVHRFEFM